MNQRIDEAAGPFRRRPRNVRSEGKPRDFRWGRLASTNDPWEAGYVGCNGERVGTRLPEQNMWSMPLGLSHPEDLPAFGFFSGAGCFADSWMVSRADFCIS